MKLTQPEWPRTLPTRAILGLATLGPIGRRLPAPGTWGSVAGILYFWAVFTRLGPLGEAALALVGAWLAVGVCGEAEARLGRADPGEVILDEFVAVPLCFLGWRSLVDPLPLWEVCLAGFVLFRFFDITKPFIINKLQGLPGGWGIVADDLAAALAACAVLHLAEWAWLFAHAN
jgi:phosphatidylglycerophosphatase A